MPWVLAAGGAYYLYTTGDLQKGINGLKAILEKAAENFSKALNMAGSNIGLPPIPTPGGNGDGGGTPTPSPTPTPTPPGGTVSGAMIYKGTGKVMNAKDEGESTRNYASGKPSDKTHEWNVESCPFDAYEFTAFVTINKIEHDDTVSMKLYGPHHKGAGSWYCCDIDFNAGQFLGGWESPHPNTTTGCVKGQSIGKIVGKKVGLKSVIWPLSSGGAHLEFYADASGGTNWKQLFSGDNLCGKKFKRDSSQQVQLRIDAAPGVKADNVTCAEIVPGQKAAVAYAYPAEITPYIPNYNKIIMNRRVPSTISTIDRRIRLRQNQYPYLHTGYV